MTEKYHDPILAFITEKGASGVNEIARAIDYPLSTVQRFLERQSYFKKTSDRKWDLPQRVISETKTETIQLMVESVENAILVLNGQLTEITSNLQLTLMPINTLKTAVKGLKPPVAEVSSTIHPELLKLDKNAKDMQLVFRKYIGKCPEQYQELLKNLDMYKLIMEKGTIYLNGVFNLEITALFLEQADELSEEIQTVLKEYQL